MEAPRLEEVLQQIRSRQSSNLGEIPPEDLLKTAALYTAMMRIMLIVEFSEKQRTRVLLEDMLHSMCALLVKDASERKEFMKLVDGYTKLAARDVKEYFFERTVRCHC